MPPHAFGADMDVPFISCDDDSIHVGIDVMAPPGAVMHTPSAPSDAGPRDDHVKLVPCSGSAAARRSEYSAAAISLVTCAPTPISALHVPPGEPTVFRAGPALPADETNTTPCRLTSSVASSKKRPECHALASP